MLLLQSLMVGPVCALAVSPWMTLALKHGIDQFLKSNVDRSLRNELRMYNNCEEWRLERRLGDARDGILVFICSICRRSRVGVN